MRLTVVLHKQHIHRWFTRFWYVKGKNRRVPTETRAAEAVQAAGFQLTDPLEVISEFKTKYPVPPESVNVVGILEKPIPVDENHPLHHERPAFLYNEKSMLVEGLPQAQNLTNTIILKQGLPDKIEEMAEESKKLAPKDMDERVKSCIIRSFLLDATQEKLPKYKNPERPAYNYPPTFGVPDYRRNQLMSDGLLLLCDSISTEAHGLVVRKPQLRTFIDHGCDLVSYNITPGMLICGKNPLEPFADPSSTTNLELPDITPFRPFVSLPKDHFYEDTDIINVPQSRHIHSAVFHFNETSNTNVTEIPVNENQIQGRTLTNSFVTAVALAKHKYENPTGVLAKPVTIQGVHTNGQWFQFAIMQLNNLGSSGIKNVAWLSPVMHMFNLCKYINGRPTLAEYDPTVFRYLHAFHRNSLAAK